MSVCGEVAEGVAAGAFRTQFATGCALDVLGALLVEVGLAAGLVAAGQHVVAALWLDLVRVAAHRLSAAQDSMALPVVAVACLLVQVDAGDVRNLVAHRVGEDSERVAVAADADSNHLRAEAVGARVDELDCAECAVRVCHLEGQVAPCRQPSSIHGRIDVLVGLLSRVADLGIRVGHAQS